jgi:hypothetical protein
MSFKSKNKYYDTRKKYYDNHKDEILKYTKQYYLDNITIITHKQIEYNKKYLLKKKIDKQQDSINQYYINNPPEKYKSEIKIYI